MRAIDADALINELNNSRYPGAPYIDAGISIAIGKVCDAPPIEPRKKGKWKMSLTKDLIGFNTVCFRCSECNCTEYSTSSFCRVCGAKMEEGEQDEAD